MVEILSHAVKPYLFIMPALYLLCMHFNTHSHYPKNYAEAN